MTQRNNNGSFGADMEPNEFELEEKKMDKLDRMYNEYYAQREPKETLSPEQLERESFYAYAYAMQDQKFDKKIKIEKKLNNKTIDSLDL